MLEMTDGYRSAIVGDVRRMYIEAMLEIIDPDIVFQLASGSTQAAWSKPDQLHDKEMSAGPHYATLETNRWLLDGSFGLIPDQPALLSGQVGYVGNSLSGADGTFPEPQTAELRFAHVDVLQALSVYFSDDPIDGVPRDFKVEVLSGGQVFYTKEFTNSSAVSVSLDGFTVQIPDAIRVTVAKWSLPSRRMRVMEIIPGLYEAWTDDVLASVDIQQRGNFACLATPYGVCTLRMDNLDRRFEPRNKSGVFQSIEDRQGIPIAIGAELADGSVEYKRVGVFYQHDGGWTTSDNDISMQWELVDIIGLLAERDFIVPDTPLPTTLAGWLALLAGQLGVNFADKWHVDPAYADAPVTADSKDAVAGKRCGDILRFACMASGTWFRADAQTGNLTAEPFWDQGNKLDLDNMSRYPTMKANDQIASLIFNLSDGTTEVISGNETNSGKVLTVSNPFLHTREQALTAARQILSQYGGIKLETTGRGDPASEIGDVDTVWLDESQATTGRRMEQGFSFSNGVLRDCKSVLLQADGSYLFAESALITQSGRWKAPAGVSRLRVVVGQAGQGGMRGQDGYLDRGEKPHMNADTGVVSQKGSYTAGYGVDGEPGTGGKIWYGTIDINPEQEFDVHIGQGGAPSQTYGVPGEMGEETTFGPYSSANGKVYPLGYTDIANGDSYGRTGVQTPRDGTSDGAAGGKGGEPGIGEWNKASLIIEGSGKKIYYSWWRVVKDPGPGHMANKGADGFVLVFWDKPET